MLRPPAGGPDRRSEQVRGTGLAQGAGRLGERRPRRDEVVDDDAEVLEVLVRVAGKYSGTPDSDGLRAGLAGQASKRVLLRLRPSKAVSWDHRKM